jgi:hypothetical protein
MLDQHLCNRLTDSRTQLDLASDCGRISGKTEVIGSSAGLASRLFQIVMT